MMPGLCLLAPGSRRCRCRRIPLRGEGSRAAPRAASRSWREALWLGVPASAHSTCEATFLGGTRPQTTESLGVARHGEKWHWRQSGAQRCQ